MLRVGFVDHHLNNWHADTFLRLLRGPLLAEGLEVVCAWESDAVGDDWCAKNGVKRLDSPEEVAGTVDGVFLFAPDNIDVHLALARRVLPAGRPTLIDKFLAPNAADAREIVALAGRHGAPIFSSSALRYAVELDAALEEIGGQMAQSGRFTGMGVWSGYGVHTLTMALRVMGHGVRRICDSGAGAARTVTLDYGGGRRAVVDVREAKNGYEALGWTFAMQIGEKYVAGRVADFDGFYTNLLRRSAAFMKSGAADMPAEEAVKTVEILEAAERSRAKDGAWDLLD